VEGVFSVAQTSYVNTTVTLSTDRALDGSRIQSRFIVLGLLFLAGSIAWADRLALSIAAPVIMEERGWSKTDLGIVFSAFSTGYLILQIPAGRLADKFGGLRILGFAILIWSLLSGLFPIVATTIVTITLVRLLLGLSQGAFGPCQASIISQYFRKDETSKAVGIANCGVFGGQMITPLLGAWIVVTWGWPQLFYVFAAAGATWCVLVFVFQYFTKGREPPAQAETEEQNTKEAGSSWALLLNSSVWVAALAFIPSIYGLWLF
jgi:MFS family permease